MLAHLISISTLVVVASTTCFDNGDKEIQGLCYKFVAQKLSYNDAVNWCHYQNPVTASFLAYVPNQFASNFLASYARTSFGQNDGNFWIGLSRATTSSPWKWDSGDSLQFTNFDSSQLGQNYAAESIVKSNWGTFSSDQKMNFVCSYNPSAPPTFVPNTAVPSTPTPTAGIPTTTTQNVPTTTDSPPDPFCGTITKSTFLYAYSAESDALVVKNSLFEIIESISADKRNRYVKFANVLFDNRNGWQIFYHDDLKSFSSSVLANLPDPSLAFKTMYNNTQIFPVLASFLRQTNIPLCGSTILILTERLSQKNEEFSMKSTMIQKKVTTHFIQSDFGLTGGYPQVLEYVSGYSGGIYTIAGIRGTHSELSYPTVVDKLMGDPYSKSSIYAPFPTQTYNSTQRVLDSLVVPSRPEGTVNLTLTITTELFTGVYLQYMSLTFKDQTDPGNSLMVQYGQNDYLPNTDLIWKFIQLKSGSTYSVVMDFYTRMEGWVSIRIYL